MSEQPISDYIRAIPDFPHEGIIFRDVTSLFGHPEGLRRAVRDLAAPFLGQRIDAVAGLEARGFVLGGAVALELGCGFIPVRKKGKLPGATLSEDYTLEYGQATVEVHQDAAQPGARILIIDDLLATGGTAGAGITLIERLGAEVVACGFVVDLPELGGSKKLADMGLRVHKLCSFEGL